MKMMLMVMLAMNMITCRQGLEYGDNEYDDDGSVDGGVGNEYDYMQTRQAYGDQRNITGAAQDVMHAGATSLQIQIQIQIQIQV